MAQEAKNMLKTWTFWLHINGFPKMPLWVNTAKSRQAFELCLEYDDTPFIAMDREVSKIWQLKQAEDAVWTITSPSQFILETMF